MVKPVMTMVWMPALRKEGDRQVVTSTHRKQHNQKNCSISRCATKCIGSQAETCYYAKSDTVRMGCLGVCLTTFTFCKGNSNHWGPCREWELGVAWNGTWLTHAEVEHRLAELWLTTLSATTTDYEIDKRTLKSIRIAGKCSAILPTSEKKYTHSLSCWQNWQKERNEPKGIKYWVSSIFRTKC